MLFLSLFQSFFKISSVILATQADWSKIEPYVTYIVIFILMQAKPSRPRVRYTAAASDPGVKSEPHEGLDIVEVDPNGIFIRLHNKTDQVI